MADSAPRFAYDSILDGGTLIASSEATGYAVENLCDWRPGTKWKPNATDNLLTNGEMALWAGGAAAAPDDWTLSGAGAAVAQDTTDYKSTPYGAQVTSAVGAAAELYQDVTAYATYRGISCTAGVWVHCDEAAAAKLTLGDDVGTTDSAAHGGTGWEYLTVVRTVDVAATRLRLELVVALGSKVATFDCAEVRPGYWLAAHPLGAMPQTPQYPQGAVILAYRAENQLARNWLFQDWASGYIAAPDSWTLTGASATVRAYDVLVPPAGEFSAALTRAGTDCYLEQSLTAAQIAALLGKKVSVGAWLYATVADRAKVEILVASPTIPTAGLSAASALHPGDSSWDWLSATTAVGIPQDCTSIKIRLHCITGNTTVYFAGVLCVAGATCTQTPHAHHAAVLCAQAHNLGTGGCTVKAEYSTTNFATATELTSSSPTVDTTLWDDFTEVTTGTAFRITITTVAGSPVPEVGELFLGDYLELTEYAEPGIDPYARVPHDELAVSEAGGPLGRSVPFESCETRLRIPWITLTVFKAGITTWWAHAGTSGKPFFFAWNAGTYPDDAWFAWLPQGRRQSAPLQPGLRIAAWECDLRGQR